MFLNNIISAYVFTVVKLLISDPSSRTGVISRQEKGATEKVGHVIPSWSPRWKGEVGHAGLSLTGEYLLLREWCPRVMPWLVSQKPYLLHFRSELLPALSVWRNQGISFKLGFAHRLVGFWGNPRGISFLTVLLLPTWQSLDCVEP